MSEKIKNEGGRGVETVEEVELENILPNPLQPRRRFQSERLGKLAQSIDKQGVVQPVILRPHQIMEGRYELVAGERRFRAVRTLGWRTIPAIVREVPDGDLLETALVENLQREQLTPIEEAQAYQSLLVTHGFTQETLAQRIGKDRSTISNMIRLLGLPLPIQNDLEQERLTVGHARAFLAIPDPGRQLELRREVVEGGFSVRETEKIVKREVKRSKSASPSSSPKAPFGSDPKLVAVREALERKLGTKVLIHYQSDGVGKMEIQFYSIDDFNRLYDLLISSPDYS